MHYGNTSFANIFFIILLFSAFINSIPLQRRNFVIKYFMLEKQDLSLFYLLLYYFDNLWSKQFPNDHNVTANKIQTVEKRNYGIKISSSFI